MVRRFAFSDFFFNMDRMHYRLIRICRRHLGLTLDEVAQRSGTERSKLSRAERGFVRLREDELERLVDVFEQTPPKAITENP